MFDSNVTRPTEVVRPENSKISGKECPNNPSEIELMIKLSHFNKLVETSAQNHRTSNICTYLYELAKVFNSFYHDCPINKLEDQNLKQARLHLVKATGLMLKEGLSLLGIPAPERM